MEEDAPDHGAGGAGPLPAATDRADRNRAPHTAAAPPAGGAAQAARFGRQPPPSVKSFELRHTALRSTQCGASTLENALCPPAGRQLSWVDSWAPLTLQHSRAHSHRWCSSRRPPRRASTVAPRQIKPQGAHTPMWTPTVAMTTCPVRSPPARTPAISPPPRST